MPIFDSFPYDTRSMDEQDWKKMMQWVRTDGILSSSGSLDPAGDSAVAPYSDMTLQIYPGLAWIQGFYFTYTDDPLAPGNYTFTISSNPTSDPRIDLVILRLDLSNNNIEYAVLEGITDPAPIPPVLTQTNLIWEIALAQVDVAAGATVINIGDITDLRDQSIQTIITPTLDLDDLGDVIISAPTSTEYLGYDSGTATWINREITASSIDLDDLDDVVITTPIANNYLGYDTGTSKWINKFVPAFNQGLNDLNDVTISSPVAGNYLRYNTGTSQWTNQSMLIGELYNDANATATTFTDTTSYVPMVTSGAGTLTTMPAGLFSQSANGVIKYLGTDTLCFHSGSTLSFDSNFNSADINIAMLLNGAYVAGSLVRVGVHSVGEDSSTAIHKILTLSTNDTITLGINFSNWAVARTVTILAYNIFIVTM